MNSSCHMCEEIQQQHNTTNEEGKSERIENQLENFAKPKINFILKW